MTDAETVGEEIGADRLSMTIRTGDWWRDYPVPGFRNAPAGRESGEATNSATAPPHLAACYAHIGRADDAREVVTRLRANTSDVIPVVSFLRDREHRELFLSGLRSGQSSRSLGTKPERRVAETGRIGSRSATGDPSTPLVIPPTISTCGRMTDSPGDRS